MGAWAFLLGGLIVWAVQFFALYVVASIFLTSTTARILTVIITLACLAANGALMWRIVRGLQAREMDDITRWRWMLAAWVTAIASVAILWQGLPGLII